MLRVALDRLTQHNNRLVIVEVKAFRSRSFLEPPYLQILIGPTLWWLWRRFPGGVSPPVPKYIPLELEKKTPETKRQCHTFPTV
jgi:hypothetical protein